MAAELLKLNVPDGSKIGLIHDVHVPHHDERALHAVIECMEYEGVTHLIPDGDIYDCGPASRHEAKKKRAVLDEGCLKESVAAGQWLTDWMRTRPCYLVYGNHEGWVENYIAMSPELRGQSTASLLGIPEDGDGWRVLPNLSRIRIGSLVVEHGNGLFPSGNGGVNPAGKIRVMRPDQSTYIGHLHRKFYSCWTTPDENGIPRTREVRGGGHLSLTESHEDYMGTDPNWQQSFGIIRTWSDGGKQRFTIDQPEIHRDRRGRPVFEYNGRKYRG